MRLLRRAAAVLPLLCSGCLTHGLVDWATAPSPLTSQVTQVEVSRVPSTDCNDRISALTSVARRRSS